MNRPRRSKPSSKQQIVAYWAKRVDECDLNVDWCDAHERCWSCADLCPLEICHIVPHALGGKDDDPSNLVLLCHQCHRENPNTTNTDLFWAWLKSRRDPQVRPWALKAFPCGLYGQYWVYRAFVEYYQLHHSDPIADMAAVLSDEEKTNVLDDFKTFADDKLVADGQRHSPATVANLMRDYILRKRSLLLNNK